MKKELRCGHNNATTQKNNLSNYALLIQFHWRVIHTKTLKVKSLFGFVISIIHKDFIKTFVKHEMNVWKIMSQPSRKSYSGEPRNKEECWNEQSSCEYHWIQMTLILYVLVVSHLEVTKIRYTGELNSFHPSCQTSMLTSQTLYNYEAHFALISFCSMP